MTTPDQQAPVSTYRLQLNPAFDLNAARGRVPYLDRLGITHVYLSPIFEAVPGSEHGYDNTDPTQIRAELGGRAALDALAEALRARGMGILLDIVPNHMAAHAANPWWWSTLRHGRASPDADIFDIDWDSADGRLVLPILGAPLDDALARREITIDHTGPEPILAYHDQRFPLRDDIPLPQTDDPASLRALLDRQHYQLIPWREGARRRNYRRFFDIDRLVGVRIEDEAVFHRTHTLVAELWRERLIDGLRIDHIDGMARPGQYLQRLHDLLLANAPDREPWVVVEKIVGPGERLPAEWPVAGTTGYETLNAISRLFIDAPRFKRMTDIAGARGVADIDFHALVVRSKRELLTTTFAGELDHLAARLADHLPDPDPPTVRSSLADLIAHLDAYRTYLEPETDHAPSIARLNRAATSAGKSASEIARVLIRGGELAERFEQLSGPVMAKGLEDTAHYRHAVLTALNEVGGEPVMPEAEPSDRLADLADLVVPGSLVPLSTHDTKRSEDVRARILALAHEPEGWERLLDEGLGTPGLGVIDVKHAVFLLQAAIGIWGGEGVEDRLGAYMVKAAREGKERSSWIDPDEGYEKALRAACGVVVGDLAESVGRVVERIGDAADHISLAQTVLRLTVPGIADTYQGTEVMNRALVDPDNRRPVDFNSLEARLARVDSDGPRDADDLKLLITSRLLRLRRELPELFCSGTFEPIGAGARVVAFVRAAGRERVCVAVALGGDRLTLRLAGAWRDVLSGRRFEGEVGAHGSCAAVVLREER